MIKAIILGGLGDAIKYVITRGLDLGAAIVSGPGSASTVITSFGASTVITSQGASTTVLP